MKKFKRKWLRWGLLISLFLIFLGVGLIFVLIKNRGVKEEDFKIAILADDGVALISFSPERKMINVLKMNDEAKVWVPGGLGWYRNEVIKGLLSQEKKMGNLSELFFYNFGFKADKILVLNKIDDWKKKFWFKYSLDSNKMLFKEEVLNYDIKDEENSLDELMVRDFAETKLVKEDLKLSIFNLTNINGLAGFMARRMEWLGFSVVSTETLVDDKGIDNCLIKYGLGVERTLGWKFINEMINCQMTYDENLNIGEVEFYFGDNFSSMIKYPSYNNI